MISACIITRNEQANIGECIQSIRSIASEVIVADTGSSDQTLAVATSFGARTVTLPWTDDFSNARNQCIAVATNPWILVIDADERLLNGLELKKLLEATPAGIGAYYLVRRDIFLHHTTFKRSKVPTLIVRVFRRDKKIRYEGSIHEVVAPSVARAGFRIALATKCFLDHRIDQYPNGLLQKKQRAYLTRIDAELSHTPGDWLTYQKAKTHWFLGETDIAVPIFEGMLENACSEFKPASLNNLASICIGQARLKEAETHLRNSISIEPRIAATRLLLSDCLLKQGHTRDALRCYTQLRTNRRLHFPAMFVPMPGFVYPSSKYHRMAMCVPADSFLRKFLLHLALRYEEDHVDSLFELVLFYEKRKKSDSAMPLIKKLRAVNPEWTALSRREEPMLA